MTASQGTGPARVGYLLFALLAAGGGRAVAAVPCETPACAAAVEPMMQCYEVKPRAFPRTLVTVEDRFGAAVRRLRFPHRLCFPVGGDTGASAPQAQRLMGWELSGSAAPAPRRRVVNQFGTVLLDVRQPALLFLPATTGVAAPPAPPAPPLLDSFQCYRVGPSTGTPPFAPIRGMRVSSGLETVVLDLLRPTHLCAPASVDGDEPAAAARATHLLCYRTRSSARFGTVSLFTSSRLTSDPATLIHRRELCVPSLVDPAPTTTSTTTTTTTSTSAPPPTTTTAPTTSTTTSTSTSTSTTTTSTSTTTTTAPSTTTTTTTTTLPAAVCGDGIVDADAGETCDDGNTAAGDCCSPTCRIDPDGTRCGDGDLCTGEEICRAGRCETPTPLERETCRRGFAIAAVTNFRDDTVSLADLTTGAVLATVPVGAGPWGVAVHPRGAELWITNREGRSVSVVDLATRAVTATIAVGHVPLGITFDASGARAYVASYGDDRVDVIDTATRARVARFRVDRGPSSLLLDPAGQTLYVASFGADTVSALDPATGRRLARIRTARKPLHLGIDGARGRLYVSNFGAGSVTVIGLVSRTVLTTVRVGRKPFAVAVDAARARAWVSDAAADTLTAIDTAENQVAASVPAAAGPLGVAIEPDGHVLVTSGRAGVLSVLDPSGADAGSVVVGALPVAFGDFTGTLANDCPATAPRCEDADPAITGRCAPRAGCEFVPRTGLDALGALLDALDATLRDAPPGSVRDPEAARVIAASIDTARAALDAGGVGAPALRPAMRGLVGAVRRALRTGAVRRDTGFRLLDLGRRARALLVR